ncbi:MAG: polyprenyl synthetase family protein [Candidatus Aminicenantia bacterium]
MELKEIYKPISQELESVESLILKVSNSTPTLKEELRTIFSVKGKMIRPAILLFVAKHYGVKGEEPVFIASAIELLHTASLIHDDLIDNSYLRRGKPSFHKNWGSDLTVLLGDYLFIKAVYLVMKSGNPFVIRALSSSASKMVEGEIEEIKKRGSLDIKMKEYFSILEKKTASLFSLSAEIGGLLGGAPSKELEVLKVYGSNIGISFQLIDDLLDIIATEEELGKPTLSDLREKKPTLPFIFLFRENRDNIKEKVKLVFEDGDFIRVKKEEIINIILNNKAKEFTLKKAKYFVEKAVKSLEVMKPSIYIQSLNQLANYIISRRW